MATTLFQLTSKILEEHRWRPLWLRGGKITDVAWIGQDVLGWCTNLRPVFFDVAENKVRLPKLDSQIIVGGATCLSGHMRRKIFAFTERKSKPRIFVYSYPSMQLISECVKGTYHAYLATSFVGDYLISLSSIPDFKMTVWSWRTGTKIASIDTNITDAGPSSQSLQINYSFPIFIAQIGNKSGKLSTWEMTTCSDTVIFHENQVTLPRGASVRDACWSPDQQNVLAIVDQDGHIYLCDQMGRGLRRIVVSQRCGTCMVIEPAALCWHRGGIVLRTTFCQIRFYRKDEQEVWRRSCYEKSLNYPVALTSHPFKWDRLFYVSRQGEVVQIKLSDDGTHAEQEVKFSFGGQCEYIDFIRPWDEYLLSIDTTSGVDIAVIQVQRGSEIIKRKFEMTGKLTAVQSHSELPLTTLASDAGEVMFISFLRYDDPQVLGRCVMQREALDLLKFSSSGRYLVACQKSRGICYFFKTSASKPIRAIFHVDLDLEVLDLLLFDIKGSLKLYILHGTSHSIPIGNLLFYYDLSYGKQESKKIVCTIALEHYYKTLHYTYEPNEFAASPYLSKHIRFFKFVDWKDLVCQNAIISGHHSKQMRISSNKKWLTTASVGGMVTIRSMRGKHIGKPTRFMTHHRRCYGVARAIANNAGDIIVALGTDGSLFAKRNLDKRASSVVFDKYNALREFGYLVAEDSKRKVEEYKKSLDEETVKLLTEPITTFATHENPDITYLEYRTLKKVEEEEKQAAADKAKILASFVHLKKNVVELLNNNETCSELERLPVAAFALDKAARERNRKAAKDEREEVRRELLSRCSELDRVRDWLKEKFWDSQKIPGQSIVSIFDDLEVTNYTIGMAERQSAELLQYAQFVRQVIKEVLHGDVIYPWKTYSDEEIIAEFAKQTSVKQIDEVKNIKFDDDEEDEIVTEEYDKTLLEGMTTHQFIEPSGLYYSQYKLYSFGQVFRDNANVIEDCKRLRLYFNKLFDDMYSIKEREMNLASERINRIFFINSELQLMFNETLDEACAHPKWEPREKPESLITVKDSELTARVYISPSQQEILDKQAAEEERLRLLMLADDFRERALLAMMDGVLEVRWEDYIKWDVPKPECLESGKNPDDYTEEEVNTVKKYMQDVQNLKAEREKYRKILQSDYAKIKNMMRESIEKFNTRLEQFQLKKMKVEAAIQQLNLRYVRRLVLHVHRVGELEKDEVIRRQIKEYHNWVPRLTEEIKKIQEIEEQLHIEYDNLLAKDRIMEKRMKNDFSTLGKSAFAAIAVQYKKRPRILLKNATTLELQDLAKAISTLEKPIYLSADCLEYIRQLEHLEFRPQNLPHSVEPTHWDTLKALRRLRINHELKEQAVAVRIEESAAYLARFEFKLTAARNAMERSREELRRRRTERQERELNVEIQLVMKMGQTEISPLRGVVGMDSANAVLVPRSTVEFVNQAILADGRRKVLTINKCIEFRRDIELEEWERECLKSSLKQLQIELYYVRATNVTRQIRAYLEAKSRGAKEEKTQQKMDRSFEATRKNQEKVLVEWQTKLEDVSDEILRLRKKNHVMDAKIVRMNVERCDMELSRDTEAEEKESDFRKKVCKMIAQRSAIVRKLLQNYDEISLLREKLQKLSCNTGALLRVDDSPVEEESI